MSYSVSAEYEGAQLEINGAPVYISQTAGTLDGSYTVVVLVDGTPINVVYTHDGETCELLYNDSYNHKVLRYNGPNGDGWVAYNDEAVYVEDN